MSWTSAPERFSMAVQAALRPAGLNQKILASVLECQQSSMTARLRGRTRWSLDEAVGVSDLLGVELSDMLKGPGPWLDNLDQNAVRERLHSVGDDSCPALTQAERVGFPTTDPVTGSQRIGFPTTGPAAEEINSRAGEGSRRLSQKLGFPTI